MYVRQSLYNQKDIHFWTTEADWDLHTYTGSVSAQPLKLPPNRGHAVVEHF